MARLDEKSGESFQNTIGPDDKYNLKVVGIKDPEELSADMASAFVWCWSIKDHIKGEIKRKGINPQLLENEINGIYPLTLCADIANGMKHGNLRESRSNLFARIEKDGITFGKDEVESITVNKSGYVFNLKNPEGVKLTAKIVDMDGNELMTAVECLQESYRSWGRISAKWDVGF